MSIKDDFFSPLLEFALPDKWQELVDCSAMNIIESNGNLPGWLESVNKLPKLVSANVVLNQANVSVGSSSDLSTEQLNALKSTLLELNPWRKGPYSIFSIDIDTEWHSDYKWARIIDHIDLANHRVLDVGCGSGYHMWRMLGAGAKQVIGIDPSVLFIMQFLAIRGFMEPSPPAMIFPFRLEQLPTDIEKFDTTFSMGVLYHRHSPLSHLKELRSTLVANGRLILETLIVDGEEGYSLTPKKRYAKMSNVWFIPSIDTLKLWMHRCGYKSIKVLDVSITSFEEQRKTDWMQFESLVDFLDPEDVSLTIEGYPAPKRVVISAISP